MQQFYGKLHQAKQVFSQFLDDKFISKSKFCQQEVQFVIVFSQLRHLESHFVQIWLMFMYWGLHFSTQMLLCCKKLAIHCIQMDSEVHQRQFYEHSVCDFNYFFMVFFFFFLYKNRSLVLKSKEENIKNKSAFILSNLVYIMNKMV